MTFNVKFAINQRDPFHSICMLKKRNLLCDRRLVIRGGVGLKKQNIYILVYSATPAGSLQDIYLFIDEGFWDELRIEALKAQISPGDLDFILLGITHSQIQTSSCYYMYIRIFTTDIVTITGYRRQYHCVYTSYTQESDIQPVLCQTDELIARRRFASGSHL